jgi:hypothetical protein
MPAADRCLYQIDDSGFRVEYGNPPRICFDFRQSLRIFDQFTNGIRQRFPLNSELLINTAAF